MEKTIPENKQFSNSIGQAVVIHGIRFVFLVIVFVFCFAYQLLENRFNSKEAFYSLYFLISISSLIQLSFFAFFRQLHDKTLVQYLLFIVEAFYITGLIGILGVDQSLLLFLYLINIILAATLLMRTGALIIATISSILFTSIVAIDPSVQGTIAYLSVGVNNIAFFTVAYLAGFLSEQLNFMGERLEQRNQDLRLLKNINQLVLNSIRGGLITTDKDNKIVQANPSAVAILALSPANILGKNVNDLFPDFEASDGLQFDYYFQRGGESLVLNMNLSPLLDDQNQVCGQIIYLQDLTQVRALEKQLRQTEKLAAIGQLAAGIAHEIRNPLAGISGSLQLIQAGGIEPEQHQRLMKIVEKEIERLNRLIGEFLDYAKPEAPLDQSLDLKQVVDEVLGILELSNTDKPISLDVSLENGVYIRGNRDKLKQAIINILVNATQAFSEDRSPILTIELFAQRGLGILKISDNGIGMPEDLKAKIFEPFRTTKHKGTGLGLAITHSILSSHKAEVLVHSELGKGSTFEIRFPARTHLTTLSN